MASTEQQGSSLTKGVASEGIVKAITLGILLTMAGAVAFGARVIHERNEDLAEQRQRAVAARDSLWQSQFISWERIVAAQPTAPATDSSAVMTGSLVDSPADSHDVATDRMYEGAFVTADSSTLWFNGTEGAPGLSRSIAAGRPFAGIAREVDPYNRRWFAHQGEFWSSRMLSRPHR